MKDSGTVGRLVPNMEMRIVNPVTAADLDFDGEGEVWLRGPNVMRGYSGHPAATAETLTADGWLRTGDIGKVDKAGRLRITDRLKELIKVKGFQVAPAELEAVLIGHPDVLDAAVVGIPDQRGRRSAEGVRRSPPGKCAVRAGRRCP